VIPKGEPVEDPGSPGAGPEVLLSTEAGDSRIVFASLVVLPGLADPARTVVVTDCLVRRYVPPEYPPERIVEVPRGEAAKSLPCLEFVYRRFLELGLGRDGTVLAVGGGSVSDLAGFAASTWMRGVDFGFAPTTVLSMVDASVGGKNGIDFGGLKNLVGSFRLPRFVLVDPSVLSTLPAREAAAGLVEAVKHAVIEGPEHLDLLESAIPAEPAGAAFRLPSDPAILAEVLSRSIRLKARIVAEDFRESGVRRKLNLGHTVGHAVEAVTGLPHGECVAAGLACALGLAARRGGSGNGARRVLDLLGRLGVPRSLEEARLAALADAGSTAALADPAAFREAVAGVLGTDKKRAGGSVLFALPRTPGSVEIVPIELAELEKFVREAP
jgi:3-dehydroquinate synthase